MSLRDVPVKNSYKGILNINNSNTELSTSPQTIKDGDGNSSPLSLAIDGVYLNQGSDSFKLPVSAGSNGQVLVSQGAGGTLYWSNLNEIPLANSISILIESYNYLNKTTADGLYISNSIPILTEISADLKYQPAGNYLEQSTANLLYLSANTPIMGFTEVSAQSLIEGYGYITETSAQELINSAVSGLQSGTTDMTGYITEVSAIEAFEGKGDLSALSQFNNDAGYITETSAQLLIVENISGMATIAYVDQQIALVSVAPVDLTGYATENYVNTALESIIISSSGGTSSVHYNSYIPSEPQIILIDSTTKSIDFETGINPILVVDEIVAPILTSSIGLAGYTQTLQFGDINDSESTSISLTVTLASAPNNFSYWAKTHSEQNYDFLKVYVDGVEVSSYSGTGGWVQTSLSLSGGEHTIEWSYVKDGSDSAGYDTAYIGPITYIEGTFETIFASAAPDIYKHGDTIDHNGLKWHYIGNVPSSEEPGTGAKWVQVTLSSDAFLTKDVADSLYAGGGDSYWAPDEYVAGRITAKTINGISVWGGGNNGITFATSAFGTSEVYRANLGPYVQGLHISASAVRVDAVIVSKEVSAVYTQEPELTVMTRGKADGRYALKTDILSFTTSAYVDNKVSTEINNLTFITETSADAKYVMLGGGNVTVEVSAVSQEPLVDFTFASDVAADTYTYFDIPAGVTDITGYIMVPAVSAGHRIQIRVNEDTVNNDYNYTRLQTTSAGAIQLAGTTSRFPYMTIQNSASYQANKESFTKLFISQPTPTSNAFIEAVVAGTGYQNVGSPSFYQSHGAWLNPNNVALSRFGLAATDGQPLPAGTIVRLWKYNGATITDEGSESVDLSGYATIEYVDQQIALVSGGTPSSIDWDDITNKPIIPGAQPFQGALIYASNSQLYTQTGIYDNIRFDTNQYDTSNIWTVTLPNRLTVPAGVTKIKLGAAIKIETDSINNNLFTFRKNGNSYSWPGNVGGDFDPDGYNNPSMVFYSSVIDVVPGDYFELMYYVAASFTTGGNGQTWFSMEIIEKTYSAAGVTGYLDNLVDVSAPAPQDGQALLWNSSTSEWQPGTPVVAANAAQGMYKPFRGALVIATSDRSHDGALSPVVWDNAEYDTNNFWSAGSPERFTIPAGVSKIKLHTTISYVSGTFEAEGNYVSIQIAKNGSTAWYGNSMTAPRTGYTDGGFTTVSPVVPVQPGDFFEVRVNNNKTGNTTIRASSSCFSIEVIEAEENLP